MLSNPNIAHGFSVQVREWEENTLWGFEVAFQNRHRVCWQGGGNWLEHLSVSRGCQAALFSQALDFIRQEII